MTAIHFTDGAAYERYMGAWSQLVGEAFLDWLRPPQGARWLDVGCGNGAFTEQIVARCAPAMVFGIDPSVEQLAFARERVGVAAAHFDEGSAMSLPYANVAFDVAVMPLVIAFVPEPLVGVREMVRVVQRGGTVAAYMWDMFGGGFPYAVVQREMKALGMTIPSPPSPDASRLESLVELWQTAGLETLATETITVHRTFVSFDDWWNTVQQGPSMKPVLASMSPAQQDQLVTALRDALPIAHNGTVRYAARAFAIQGRVPIHSGYSA